MPVLSSLLLLLLGEALEFGASALGAKHGGATRRGMIGSLVGAVLLSAVGALTGAVLSEVGQGKKGHQAWEVGKAAFVGRLLGTLGKMICAMIMFATSVIALFV